MNLVFRHQTQHKYLLRRDKHDPRDHRFCLPPRFADPQVLPAGVDLRANMAAPYNQGQYGTCYANAAAGLVQYYGIKTGQYQIRPSRLFIAWNACADENTTDEVDGIASLRDVAEAVRHDGWCGETEGPSPWDYTDAHMNCRPDPGCVLEAARWTIEGYQAIPQDLHSIKACLAQGNPFMFGMTVYPQFESADCAKTGIVETPSWWTRHFGKSLGGHAVDAFGYSDAKGAVLVRNSWDITWGDQGYFWLPYDYITDSTLCFDQWMFQGIKLVAP